MAHGLLPTSLTRCPNCITATRQSSAFSVLHLTSALHHRPFRALRPRPHRPHLHHPRLVVPRVKYHCAQQQKHRARHLMITKRHLRVPCWLLRASQAGCQDSDCTLRRDKWQTWSSRDRSTNSSLTAYTHIRIPSEYVSGRLYDNLLIMAAVSVQRVPRRVHSNYRW